MLHFACHCQEGKRGDTLLISFIKDEEIEENALVLELVGLKHFLAPQGAEKLSGQGKEVDELTTPETLLKFLTHMLRQKLSNRG